MVARKLDLWILDGLFLISIPGALKRTKDEKVLILVKDVMQHWTNAEVTDFMDKMLARDDWDKMVIANDWRYWRDPSKNGKPRDPLSNKLFLGTYRYQ